ncbi:hypothetical protein AVEN_85853-1 [Araneus ventricosus]|uniref:Uncharacterized protein n=1 Tax=Araneus ventricosus TaxID=182803 RepID=A0A4Y2GZV2_ARAVE|nr:hypothetical protein AVEN_85853-1 [Araneus ventricosus]
MAKRPPTGVVQNTHNGLPKKGVRQEEDQWGESHPISMWRTDFIRQVFISKRKKNVFFGHPTIHYPNIPSALRSVLHCEDLPIQKPPSDIVINSDDEEEEYTEPSYPGQSKSRFHEHSNEEYINSSDSTVRIITSTDLSDLVRDLNLSKAKAVILASRLRQCNLLEERARVSSFRNLHIKCLRYFQENDNILFCSDVTGLMKKFGLPLDVNEQRLFIDSSKLSLKMVLLHNGNELPNIPTAYAPHMKEIYEHLQQLLHRIKYTQYEWSICDDLKVVALLMGFQQGVTKFFCFLCEWNSRATDVHYIQKDWPHRMCLTPGKMNVMNTPLVSQRKSSYLLYT